MTQQTQPTDGGPAFPTLAGQAYVGLGGMSLRDWFAGMALQGILASYANLQNIASAEQSAKEAFERADALLSRKETHA